MKIKFLPKSEVAEWVRQLHHAKPSMALGTLLAGDRWTCVSEVAVAEVENEIVGIATIAPQGEEMSGEPTMVALYVLSEFRSQGVGFALFKSTIDYMIGQGMEPVRLDILNSKVFKMLQRLPVETRQKLKVVDQSMGGKVDFMMES